MTQVDSRNLIIYIHPGVAREVGTGYLSVDSNGGARSGTTDKCRRGADIEALLVAITPIYLDILTLFGGREKVLLFGSGGYC